MNCALCEQDVEADKDHCCNKIEGGKIVGGIMRKPVSREEQLTGALKIARDIIHDYLTHRDQIICAENLSMIDSILEGSEIYDAVLEERRRCYDIVCRVGLENWHPKDALRLIDEGK